MVSRFRVMNVSVTTFITIAECRNRWAPNINLFTVDRVSVFVCDRTQKKFAADVSKEHKGDDFIFSIFALFSPSRESFSKCLLISTSKWVQRQFQSIWFLSKNKNEWNKIKRNALALMSENHNNTLKLKRQPNGMNFNVNFSSKRKFCVGETRSHYRDRVKKKMQQRQAILIGESDWVFDAPERERWNGILFTWSSQVCER